MSSIQSGALIDDRYLLLEQIGEGGMGYVFKAKELDLERIVAIKFLQFLLLTEPKARRRFEREAAVLAELSHPGIITFYRFGIEEDKFPYLVLEFIKGKSLREILNERGRLSIPECQDITIQICEAMATAHERGILHRDLKPGNIIVDEESGLIKIVDFGLAGIIGNEQMQKLTQTGSVIGSLPYMSPEQCLGGSTQTVDHRADIYSLGCVLFEIVCGVPPFVCSTPMEMITKHTSEVPPLLSDLVDGVSKELQAIVGKMLAKSPTDRYSSMNELMQDLISLQSGKPEDVRAPLIVRRKNSPVLLQVIAGVTFVVIAATGFVVFLTKPTQVEFNVERTAKQSTTQSVVGLEKVPAARLLALADRAIQSGSSKEIVVRYLHAAIAASSNNDDTLECYRKLAYHYACARDYGAARNALNSGDAILQTYGKSISPLQKLEFYNVKSYYFQVTKNWKEVLSTCDQAMKLKDSLDDAFRRRTIRMVLYQKATVYENSKQYAQAIACVEEAINLSDSEPDEMHGFLFRCRLAAAAGNNVKLKESFLKLKDTERLGEEMLYDAALELTGRGVYDVALALTAKAEQRVLNQSPPSDIYIRCLLLEATLLHKQGKDEQSRSVCTKIRSLITKRSVPSGVLEELQQLEAGAR